MTGGVHGRSGWTSHSFNSLTWEDPQIAESLKKTIVPLEALEPNRISINDLNGEGSQSVRVREWHVRLVIRS
ncbi:hypothetical protein CCP4SC76_290014 [Gammaproteobacteria bacterium]